MLVARLTDPARKSWRDGSVKHLLVGIAECGVCGAPCRRVKNRNTPSYACGKGFCVVRSQVRLDEFVTQVVVVRLSQPDVWELFTSTEDTEAAEAAEQARVLRARLTAFYDQAAEGKLTPTGLVRIERRLLEQIKAAERRAQPRSMPTVLTDIAGPDAAVAWAGLSVPQRREVVRALLVPRIMPTGKGTRFFDPGKIEVLWRNA
jgi:site-specific DNA recombinase